MTTYQHIKELREERARLFDQAQSLIDKASEQKRGMTDEESGRFDEIHADAAKLRETIHRAETQRDLEAEIASEDRSHGPRSVSTGEVPKFGATNFSDEGLNKDEALRRWMARGPTALSKDERRALGIQAAGNKSWIEVDPNPRFYDVASRRVHGDREARFQSVGTAAAGGNTVPEGFWNALIEAQLHYGGMRMARTFQFNTASGNDLPVPTVNDTGNTGAIITENTEVDELDVTFGSTTLNAYKYTSKAVRVSSELLQDSAFDIGSYLGRALGTRLGRILNTHFTTGTGTNQPNGIITAAAAGKTAASQTQFTYLELIDLVHSVDIAYRDQAEFMMHDLVAAMVAKLQDGNSRPIWTPSPTVGGMDTLLGYPVVINNDMEATPATTDEVMVFGDFSHYWIRDVGSVRLLRLDERYAEFDQTAFLAFSRHDGDLIKGESGAGPLKTLTMA